LVTEKYFLKGVIFLISLETTDIFRGAFLLASGGDLAEIRVGACQWGIRSIIKKPPDLVFTVDNMGMMDELFEGATGTVRMPDSHTLHWRLPANYLEPPTMLTVLRRRLSKSPVGSGEP